MHAWIRLAKITMFSIGVISMLTHVKVELINIGTSIIPPFKTINRMTIPTIFSNIRKGIDIGYFLSIETIVPKKMKSHKYGKYLWISIGVRNTVTKKKGNRIKYIIKYIIPSRKPIINNFRIFIILPIPSSPQGYTKLIESC